MVALTSRRIPCRQSCTGNGESNAQSEEGGKGQGADCQLNVDVAEIVGAKVRADMDLDKPVHIQVARFVWNMLHGSFGNDVFSGQPISRSIGSALPHTLILAWVALGLAVLVGIPLGVFSATHPNSWIDRVTAIFSISFIASPELRPGAAWPMISIDGMPL